MTAHLPECPISGYEIDTEVPCICDRLRACEQRVMLLRYNEIKGWSAMKEAIAYDAGLDAAREAVAGVKKFVEFPGQPVNYIHPDFFLAAIDALKEKP